MRPSRGSLAPIGPDDYAGFNLILIVVGLAILGWAGWSTEHASISAAALRLAHWEMQVIGWFSDRFRLADAEVLKADPETVQFGDLVKLYRNLGLELLYPAMAVVLGLAAACFRRAGAARFSRTLDLNGLMAEQARTFRAVSAFVGRSLKLSEVRAGEPRPVDPALNVAEWVKAFAAHKGQGFDETAARRELVCQLGACWTGAEAAAPQTRCMLAVFALHGIRRRDEAAGLLGLLSEGLPRGRKEGGEGPQEPLAFDRKSVAVADRVLRELEVADWALKVMGAHAFTTPGLMSVLNAARLKSGVLAPAEFAFLKLVDRRLYYALHSLGFEAEGLVAHPHPGARIEGLGARAHWAAERAIGAPIGIPEIGPAVEAIRGQLKI